MPLHANIPGTVLLWQFQDDLTDASDENDDGTVFVGAEAYEDLPGGEGLRAIDLSSTGVMSAQDSAIQIEGALTVEFLMVPQDNSQSQFYFVVARDGGAPGSTIHLYSCFYEHTTGRVVWQDSPGGVGTNHPFTTSNQGTLNELHHYAFTKSAPVAGVYTLKYYRDGVLIDTTSTTAVTANGTERVRVGNYEHYTVPFLQSPIASFRIVNYERSAAQILADANGALATSVQPTADYIADPAQPFRPFYYLKISGLPYYFGATIDPTDTRYGENAWTLPDGYTWVKGMDIPGSEFDQQLRDIIGGIATPEKVRLSLLDFSVVNAAGPHSFFGRLLSPGRTAASATATTGLLNSNITAAQTSGTFTVKGAGGAFVEDTDTYIGGETIGVTTVTGPDAENIYTLTIGERNKYPCHEDFPPRSLYRVETDGAGEVDHSKSPYVSQGDPLSFINRSAALYIGHLTPTDKPEPEENSLCRLIGHLRNITYGREPGKYEFEVESVIGDLDKSLVAPHLAHAEIHPGLELPAGDWQKLAIRITGIHDTTGIADTDAKIIQVPLENYRSAESLLAAINTQLIAAGAFDLGVFDGTTFYVVVDKSDYTVGSAWSVRFRALSVAATPASDITWTMEIYYPQPGGVGLASALGFSAFNVRGSGVQGSFGGSATITSNNEIARIELDAPRVAPRVFIPLKYISTGIQIDLLVGSGGFGTSPGEWFFTDQGDGSGTAYVRLSDGQVVPITAKTSTTLTLLGFNSASPFYYCELKQTATIEQVIHIPSGNTTTGEKAIFQVIASKGYGGDGEYNVFPEGAGLGFIDIMDTDSFDENAVTTGASTYSFDIDRTMKFGELWSGPSKLFGLFIVWDVENEKIGLRAVKMNSAVLAEEFEFSESNRVKTTDRTTVSIDMGYLRTGWGVKYGWDYKEKKLLNELNIKDDFALNTYRIASRTETIEDRLVPPDATFVISERYLPALKARSPYTRYPWAKLARSVNKCGLLLTPGNHHKIIDNTIVNPFTGLMGIESDDEVYVFITGVRMNYETGEVSASMLVDQLNDSASLRPWSPTALVDFGATDNGYDDATGIVTLTSFYTNQADMDDGIDFLVGDEVLFLSLQNEGAPGFEVTSTISAVAADGSTVTVDAGLGAFPPDVQVIMVLQPWAATTAARKTTAATRVTFQGDGDTMLIDGDARLHKWS